MSSLLKRHFTAVVDSKEHGLYISSSPSSAARKIVSKLCAASKSKKVEFCVREITQGSKKKTYGPYLGEMKKLAKPIELKGRIIRFETEVHLKKKKTDIKTLKKIGKKMRGGNVETKLFLIKYCNINNNKAFSQNSGNTYYLSTDDVESVVEKKIFEKRYLFFGKPEFIHFRKTNFRKTNDFHKTIDFHKNMECYLLYYQYVVYYDLFNKVRFEMYNHITQKVENIRIFEINEKSLYELKLFLEQPFQNQDNYYNIINNYVTQYIQLIENNRQQKRQKRQERQGLQEQLERIQEQKRLQNKQEQIQRLQNQQEQIQRLQNQQEQIQREIQRQQEQIQREIQRQQFGYMTAQV
jgi:hypothetical protein